MVTSGFYLDERRAKNDGTYPIKVRIIRDRKVAMVNTGLSCDACDWVNERVSKRAVNAIQKNALLNRWMSEIDDELIDLERKGRLRTLPIKEIVAIVEVIVKGSSKKKRKTGFIDVLDEFIERKSLSEGTQGLYISTRAKVEEYAGNPTLEEMSVKWMEGFDKWMSSTMRINSRGIHLRNIRAVFNYAIDEEITTAYPFRRFSIKKEETEKRCLTVEQVRELRDYPVEEYQRVYRDMWMLMFYMVGVNAVDLFGAKKSQLQNGRLVYKRAKTGTLYSILVQPEAMEIIERYKGDGEYLLNVMDGYSNYKDFLHRMNWNLQRIGACERKGLGGKKYIDAVFPELTSYWSRHTWATIAAELDIPIEVISHALGHKIGSDVTAIYVKFNRMKVDDANRRVIDFLNEG